MPTLAEKNRPGSWTYDGDPGASSLSWVRWRVGDVFRDDQLQSDQEIAQALTDASSNQTLAAAMVCDRIAADFSREVDLTINDGSGASRTRSLSQRARAYAALAKQLRDDLASGSSLAALFPAPYAGGISQADKDTQTADADLVAPAFTVDMQDYL